ncbi:MAG: hypothetical protein HYX92_14175 [Chloroflexi bacterium]|nr:hypothetical protein [Chloroflexota bacterium]
MGDALGLFINFLPIVFFLGVMLYFIPRSSRGTQKAVDLTAKSLEICQEQTELLRKSVELNEGILAELKRLGPAHIEKNHGSEGK